MVETVEVQPGIHLAYEVLGGTGPTVLLIMGLGSQMLLWPEAFCEGLIERGFRVVRFDNRDVGLSTRLDDVATPSPSEILLSHLLGRQMRPAYSLEDMARDTDGLLHALDLDSVHVVGASMGGMIAQTVAIQHPRRVRSLTSIMSSPGPFEAGWPTARAIKALISRPSPTREDVVEHMVRTFHTIGSPVYPTPAAELRAVAERCYDRGVSGRGFYRQLGAVLGSRSRTERLASVRVPALVIHGTPDPLVSVRAGHQTAAALPHSELLLFDEMGHDLPAPLWPAMLDAIAVTARRADQAG